MCFCCAHNMTFASGKGLFLHKGGARGRLERKEFTRITGSNEGKH